MATLLLVAATTASAACDYPSAAFTIDSGWGRETTPNVSTCDSDGIYKGKVADTQTDGSCVWVQFREGTTVYTQATSCNSWGVNYTFWDQNGDDRSNVRICRSAGCTSYYYTDFY